MRVQRQRATNTKIAIAGTRSRFAALRQTKLLDQDRKRNGEAVINARIFDVVQINARLLSRPVQRNRGTDVRQRPRRRNVLMQMRLPDRLQFTLDIDAAALPLRCPPLTLLTLVENAVRHGIDPAEEGGRIEVVVALRDERCCIAVCDSGVGLRDTGRSAGIGLAGLRERLQLAYGPHAQLRIAAHEPRGVRADIEFPVPTS